jgi:hypothetical protein
MDAHDLYGLPLERFVPERAALAKALRGEGRRDEAAEAAKLAKPSIAAWAVNQLVRTQRTAVDELFEAGDTLRGAQDDVIAGRGDARALREAAERERQAVAVLMEAARGLFGSQGKGLTAPMLERVADTLHAVALDAEARQQAQDGCLTQELRHVGLGGGGPTAGRARRASAAAAPKAAPKPNKEDRARLAEERAAREREAARRAERLAAAREAEALARRESDRAQRALAVAEERRQRAAEALSEAEDELAAAHDRVAKAAEALGRSRQALDEI